MKLNNYLHRFDTIRKHFFAARQKQKRMLLLGQKQNRPSDKLLHWSILSLDLEQLGCYHKIYFLLYLLLNHSVLSLLCLKMHS